MATLLQRANFNGRNGSYFFLDLYYDLLSQNQTANTSSVRYYAYVGSTGGYSGSGSSSSVYINGNRVGSFSSIGRGSNTLIGTLDVTINHDTNGNGTASYSASANTNWTLGSASLSGSFTLPRIARADNITSPMVYTIGATHTIRITQNSTSFTHTVRYTFGSLNGIIASNVKDSCTWFVPTTFYNEFTSGSSKTGTLYCDTYSGSTLLGTTSITATFIPNSTTAKPTVSFNYTSDSLSQTLTGNTKGIIGGRSSINYTITGTPKHNATIAKYYLSNSSSNLPEVSRTGTLNNVSGNKYYTRVQDSRGLNSDILTITLSPYVNYVQLAITNCTFERENDLSNKVYLTLKGNYFNGNFGATDNELSVKLFYRKQGESSWGSAIDITSYATISENTFSITNQLIGSNFSYEDSYEFRVVAQDKVVTDDSVSSNRTVTEGVALFDIGKNDVLFKGIKLLEYIESKVKLNVDLMYPVGSIYLSVNSTNPSQLFGGEWEQWGKGRVPVGVDTTQTEFNTVEKTGGEKTHTLIETELPYIRGDFNFHGAGSATVGSGCAGYFKPGAYRGNYRSGGSDLGGAGSYDGFYFEFGGNQPHNNLQPYITCYMWKRTA